MTKKLTISVSDELYEGLYAKIGAGRISKFIENIASPHVIDDKLIEGYRQMSLDKGREQDAQKWTESLFLRDINETW